jgi:hypothetical protein
MIRRRILATSLRREGPIVAVTAFVPLSSRAATGTPVRLGARPISGGSCKRQTTITRHGTVSATVEEARSILDLRKALDTTHPSFEVFDKDIVEEQGAYCTLYRHKKSGAELLSVAVYAYSF